LNRLRLDGRIGILSRSGDRGSRVRATYAPDGVEIDELVAFREKDVGGEG